MYFLQTPCLNAEVEKRGLICSFSVLVNYSVSLCNKSVLREIMAGCLSEAEAKLLLTSVCVHVLNYYDVFFGNCKWEDNIA